MGPLLTLDVHEQMQSALRAGIGQCECSLDLDRSIATIELAATGWTWQAQTFPYPEVCKDRTIYYWSGAGFAPVARYTTSLIKLVPTQWGAPTFEIDGIKMLPTATMSPYLDARDKVALIQPRGKLILDTCGGLGYFAAWCLQGQATRVLSFEKNADVIWLRSLNPWSPQTASPPVVADSPPSATMSTADARLALEHADVAVEIEHLPAESVDAILHDPPRFGIAGELYSQAFYEQLARVIRRNGRLFHYTGSPNKLTSGRDVPNEVTKRLQRAGFTTQLHGDGVLASRRRK